MAVDWSRLRQIVETHDRFLITSHVRPDGDAIGSELGMARLLTQKGKQSVIANCSSLPPRYRFLDPDRRIRRYGEEISAAELAAIEVVIILDTSAWGQLGRMADFVRATSAKKIIVDHHISEDDMGAELFKDTSAAACGLLVAEAVEHLGCEMTRDVAEPLFVAIATDTGWFRFGSTDGRTLRVAARLIEAGIGVDRLYRTIFEESSMARLKLLGKLLDSLEVVAEGRVAHGAIRLDDLKATGAAPADSEDMVNYTLSITGIEVGLLFVELASGGVKVSFRSRDAFDCTEVAGQFGGGGHRQAAGATIDAPLADAQSKVIPAVTRRLRNPSSK
jgi:phosphoesterase RecJ-like protein